MIQEQTQYLQAQNCKQKEEINLLFQQLHESYCIFQKITTQNMLETKKIENKNKIQINKEGNKVNKSQNNKKKKILFLSYFTKKISFDILSFLNIQDLLKFRSLSKRCINLVNQNLTYLMQFNQKKEIALNNCKRQDYYMPIKIEFRVMIPYLNKLIKRNIDKSAHPNELKYIDLLFNFFIIDKKRCLFKNYNIIDKIKMLKQTIANNSQIISYYCLNEVHRRYLQKIQSFKIDDDNFEQYKGLKILQTFFKEMFTLSSNNNYYLICKLQNNETGLETNNINLKIKTLRNLYHLKSQKQNFLPYFMQLNNLFDKNICSFLNIFDFTKLRNVCQYFNNIFLKNINYYAYILSKNVNFIQTNINLEIFQKIDENNDDSTTTLNEQNFQNTKQSLQQLYQEQQWLQKLEDKYQHSNIIEYSIQQK